MSLPLNDERTTNPSRLEEMSLEYWTALHQPLYCLLEPFDCPLEEYDAMFHGVITLTNVNIEGWSQYFNEETNENYLDINLILNQTLDLSTQVFDVLKFRYEWDIRYLDSHDKHSWRCFDLHWDREQYADITVNPVDDLTDFSSYNSKVKLDAHQDCIINQHTSSVEYVPVPEPDDPDEPRGDPTLANFKVHFYRKLQTAAGVQDAQLSVGYVCDIGFSYAANFGANAVVAEPEPEPEPEPVVDDAGRRL